MPKFDSSRVKHRMAELDVSLAELSKRTSIPWGSLRNAIAGRDPLRLGRICQVSRALTKPDEELWTVVAYLLGADGDGVPDPPPDQTKSKPKPERRKEKGGSGPKRDQNVRGVA